MKHMKESLSNPSRKCIACKIRSIDILAKFVAYIFLNDGLMVFNATFSNISVILWWSVLLVEQSGVPEETHRPVVSH